MKKNGVKSFVFSFLLSLLAVVAVNKAVFDMPEEPIKHQKKNKSVTKTISLFSEKQDNIDLSKSESSFEAIENLVLPEKDYTEQILPEINITPKQASFKEKTLPTTNIVYQQQEKKLLSEDLNQIHKKHISLNAASEMVLESKISTDETQETENLKSESNIVYTDISDTLNDEKLLLEAENKIFYSPEEKNNEVKAVTNDIKPEENSIPLTENQDLLHENIDILTSAQTTQIAMLEPNSLINSIDSFDKPEEKHIAEIDLKKEFTTESSWTQMSTISTDENDNPWVVAKGNRFAKNKIAQIDALAEDEEEKQVKQEEQEASSQEDTPNQETPSSTETNSDIEENIASATETNHPITVYKEEDKTQSQQNDPVTKDMTSEDIEKTIDEEDFSLQISQETDKNNNEDRKESDILSHKPLLIPSDGNGTKLAYKMIQNLIIPLPEDIATDADLTPQLSSEPNQKPVKVTKKESKELKKEEKESGLFKSISSWFSSNDKSKDDNKKSDKQQDKKKKKRSGIFLFDRENDDKENRDLAGTTEIMPAELKLSFQPNRAEISGHTLRWIHAFADNARDNHGIYIEIRIDGTSSFALQQKRLNLLSSIFANRGVDFRKVNVIFTSREPNSFIIRNIRFNNNDEVIVDDEALDTNYQYW